MPDYTTGDIFTSRCQAIVNPVNCVGIMGAGLALQFKHRFPDNFASYADACRAGTVAPGRMHVFDTGAEHPRFIVNFPTKRHWRDPSQLDDIAQGMDALDAAISEHGIQSIAIPPLGSGLGGLAWDEVRPLIANRLSHREDLQIVVYEPHRAMTHSELPPRAAAQSELSSKPPSPLLWAGIGARKTPAHILDQMTILARRMDEAGWHLSSGGADGADRSFAAGASTGQRTVWLPWSGYNGLSGPDCRVPTSQQLQQCLAIAERHHPAWHKCGQGVRKLHARNVNILLGPDLNRPVNAVVCWTERGQAAGGTGMGLRIAAEHDIPVFNLASMSMEQAWAALRQLQQASASRSPDSTNSAADRNLAAQDRKARVVHLRDAPPDAIHIDRRTPWGNPFIIGKDGSRREVIAKFHDHFWARIHAGEVNLDQLARLHGKNLACHCAPLACHGDVLAEAAAWAVVNKTVETAPTAVDTPEPRPASSSIDPSTRTYSAAESCVFRYTRADWGVFSNFAALPGAISAAGHEWPTSEHLYQAAKYRQSPDVQNLIAASITPRDAAKHGRNRQNTPDTDWTSRRVDAMRWVLRMKREANPALIDTALEQTTDRPIVEFSNKDTFWGALPDGDSLVGQNVLGRLWMELRQQVRDGDPRALASAWDNPITPSTDRAADADRDQRTRINNRYLALLEATDQTPALIPYQDGFTEFRSQITAAIATARQPPEYLEKLQALDQRLADETNRSQRASDAYARIEELLVQLPHLPQSAAASEPILAGFAQDCADCLAHWRELDRDPNMAPHLQRAAGAGHQLRIDTLAPYADRCDHTPQKHDHPIVAEYTDLLALADNNPELLAYQPGFDNIRQQVRQSLSSQTADPRELTALRPLASSLDDSHTHRNSVQDLQQRFSRCASAALDLEDWAAVHPQSHIADCPDYDAWRKAADGLVDEYHRLSRDRSYAPHLQDRLEVKAFFNRRLDHICEPRLQRPSPISTEQALQHSRSRTAEQDTGRSMGL